MSGWWVRYLPLTIHQDNLNFEHSDINEGWCCRGWKTFWDPDAFRAPMSCLLLFNGLSPGTHWSAGTVNPSWDFPRATSLGPQQGHCVSPHPSGAGKDTVTQLCFRLNFSRGRSWFSSEGETLSPLKGVASREKIKSETFQYHLVIKLELTSNFQVFHTVIQMRC